MDVNEKDKKDFINYERIRKSGKYNMITDASIIAREIGVSRDRYIWIISNHKELNKLYCKYI